MREEVLSHGDERQAGPGRALGTVVALALVAMAVVAISRSTVGDPAARPSPSPTAPWAYPTSRPAPVRPFASHVTVRRPPAGEVRTELLGHGLPGFVVPGTGDELPSALGAAGGEPWAPVLVGWCERTGLFQDGEGRYFYDHTGQPLLGGAPLPRFPVRAHPLDPTLVEVVVDDEPREPEPARRSPAKCRDALLAPKLPPPAGGVHATVAGFRVVRGRYVVRTETRAFCRAGGSCAADGWEVYGLGGLPRGDLAGGYVWEGEFVVRGGTDGSLTVIRLPEARLVRRERVGASVRVGLPHGTRRRDGRLHLVFNPFRHASGDPQDDSPGNEPPQGASDWTALMTDETGGRTEYAVRDDVQVVLGPGLTGLGRPRATPETLERFLVPLGNLRIALWVVLDEEDRVLRVVVAG